MTKRNLLCVILAAGKGTRMKSTLPKVLHKVAGIPMLHHVMKAAQSLNPHKIVVVIGPDDNEIMAACTPHETVVQHDRLGTGHAVQCALKTQDLMNTDVLVLYGDVPLVPSETLRQLVDKHQSNPKIGATILAMRPVNQTGYGRLEIDNDDHVIAIIEELDCTNVQRNIDLCNSGMMILRGDALTARMASITNQNKKGEYYLTDIVAITRDAGDVCTYVVGPADDLDGVNDRVQLAQAEHRLQQKLRDQHMRGGVTMIDPNTVFLSTDTVIGQDVIIEPNVFIGAGVIIGNNVLIHAFCHVEGVDIKQGAHIGPFVHIRPGSVIGEDVRVSYFVEINRSNLGTGTKVSQMSVITDANIGQNTNVGAGAMILNWDGVNKSPTTIGDRVFVGGNTTLVAPVTLADDSFVTAGSVITKNVALGDMAFGRARQVNVSKTPTAQKFSVSQKKKG